MDYNNGNGYSYADEYSGEPQKNSGVGIAAMICGIVAFFIDPLYVTSLAALIMGIIGVCDKTHKKGMAIAGIILAVVSGICQIMMDIFLTVFSAGIGTFSLFC